MTGQTRLGHALISSVIMGAMFVSGLVPAHAEVDPLARGLAARAQQANNGHYTANTSAAVIDVQQTGSGAALNLGTSGSTQQPKFSFQNQGGEAPFVFPHIGGANFTSAGSTVFDPVMYWGFNVQNGNSKINSGVASFAFSMEGNYWNSPVHAMEYNFDFTNTSGSIANRMLAFGIDRDNGGNSSGYQYWHFSIGDGGASNFQILDRTMTTTLWSMSPAGNEVLGGSSITLSGANPSINGTNNSALTLGTNNTQHFQIGAAGGVSLPNVSANTSYLTGQGGGSNTGADVTPMVRMDWTLNTSGQTDVISYHVTDTAHGAGTKIFHIFGSATGNADRFSVDTGGTATIPSGQCYFIGNVCLWNAGNNNIAEFQLNGTPAARFSNGDGTGKTCLIFGTGNGDTYLCRDNAAAAFRLGATDAAAPVAQTVRAQGVVAGTSNTAGVSLTFQGSAGTGTGAGGSIIFQTAPAGTTGTAVNGFSTALTLDQNLHASFGGTAPALTSCGTSPTIAGTDTAGEVTTGTATPTACTITFSKAYAAQPYCTVIDRSALANLTSYTVSTSTIVLTTSAASSQKVVYHCIGA